MVDLLRIDASAAGVGASSASGPLHGLVRNWFEFLDPSGTAPSLPDILDVYRGKFTPQFNRRFEPRDAIIDQRPEVVSILLNNVLERYRRAGVGYVELSVSVKDLLLLPMRRCLVRFAHQKDELIELAAELDGADVDRIQFDSFGVKVLFKCAGGNRLSVTITALEGLRGNHAHLALRAVDFALDNAANDAASKKFLHMATVEKLCMGASGETVLKRVRAYRDSLPGRASKHPQKSKSAPMPAFLSACGTGSSSTAPGGSPMALLSALDADQSLQTASLLYDEGDYADDSVSQEEDEPAPLTATAAASSSSDAQASSSSVGRAGGYALKRQRDDDEERACAGDESAASGEPPPTRRRVENEHDAASKNLLGACSPHIQQRSVSVASGTEARHAAAAATPTAVDRLSPLLSREGAGATSCGNSQPEASLSSAVPVASYFTPIVPNPQTASDPWWRPYVTEYHDADRHQKHYFLAAFPRTRGGNALSDGNALLPTHSAIEAGVFVPGVFTPGEPSPYEPASSPCDAFRRLALLAAGKSDEALVRIAQSACNPDILESIYPDYLGAGGLVDQLIKQLKTAPSRLVLLQTVVGLDWVGDELGVPYCALAHPKVARLVVDMWTRDGAARRNFGIRVHAGEGVMRPSSLEAKRTPFFDGYKLHMYILMEGLERIVKNVADLCQNLHPFSVLRIGHGVAFLAGAQSAAPGPQGGAAPGLQGGAAPGLQGGAAPGLQGGAAPGPEGRYTDPDLNSRLDSFREFLRDKRSVSGSAKHGLIVCELNPTSNHMLLGDTFVADHTHNVRTLPSFVAAELPVVLCTDDDGIWAIRKCREHYRHISVAHELCQSIVKRDIQKQADLVSLIERARGAAFAQQAPGAPR